MRIATGCIGHETNTFSLVPTNRESFHIITGGDIVTEFRDTATITGGIIDAADKWNMELVPLLWTFASPSGMVAQDAYEPIKAQFLERLRVAGPVDGIVLDLHGAMVTELHEDAEADLIAAVRSTVGDIPIVTTFDLHANISPATVKQTDVIIGFDTYPHVDMYDRGHEAAELIRRMILGEVAPTMAYRQLPLLTPPPVQCTMKQPMEDLVKRLHQLEAKPGVLTATLSMGFPFADIHDAGLSIMVTTNDDKALAEKEADDFARHIWSMRESFQTNLVSNGEAMDIAAKAEDHPVVLAEGSDNPGGGGPCDGTLVLRPLVEAGFAGAVVAVIADPESVASAVEAGVGNRVFLHIGGKTDDLHGKPVQVECYVKTITDGRYVFKGPMGRGKTGNMGRTAVVVVGGVEIVITERRHQPYDAEVLRSVGIEPTDRRLIALKSAVHYRADYTSFAHEILEVDTPGVHSPNLYSFTYEKLRRPMYPFDEDAAYD